MLLIFIVLVIIILAAALFLKKAWGARFADAVSARERTHPPRPTEKSEPAATWVPGLRPVSKQWPHSDPVPAIDALKNCTDLQQCLNALAGKYALDSFTIATSDGLVFASSGGTTAQADAAHYNRYAAGKDPAGMTIIGLDHKGSELTGIIRSAAPLSPEIRRRIENDTKDILNRWI